MFTLTTTSLPDERWCIELLRKVRWNDHHVTCPHCNSGNVKKDGGYRKYQKYCCKRRRKWFNDKTGTVFHYSHTPLGRWFIVLYLLFVLWPGCSIRREPASESGIPYARCYRFVRTVMEKLRSLLEAKLDGTAESDEFYNIKAGLKGR
jgi:transposase-like protein